MNMFKKDRHIPSWVFSIVALFVGIVVISDFLMTGVFFILSGIILNPIVRGKLHLKRWLSIILFIVLLFIGLVSVPVSEDATPSVDSSTSQIVGDEEDVSIDLNENDEAVDKSGMSVDASDAFVNQVDADSSLSEEQTLDDVMSGVEENIKNSFGDNYRFSYDETAANLEVWSDGVVAGVYEAANGNTTAQEAWGEILSSLSEVSSSIEEDALSAGCSEYTVAIYVMNDQNTDAMLAMIVNGSILYAEADYIIP